VDLHISLNSYSICEKHYNQVIATKHFYQKFSDDPTHKFRIDVDSNNNSVLTCDSGINEIIDIDKLNLWVEPERTEELLEESQIENSEYIMNLNNEIAELRRQIEDQK